MKSLSRGGWLRNYFKWKILIEVSTKMSKKGYVSMFFLLKSDIASKNGFCSIVVLTHPQPEVEA